MFSYEDYSRIVNIIKDSKRQKTYLEAINSDDFIIMRHDVEYSVERAYRLSRLEDKLDFKSTYYFQWTNNTYNLLSKINLEMIHEMHKEGHEIGLHYALNGLTDMQEIRRRIKMEIKALSELLEFDITSFSVHRPTKEILRENICLPNVINAYQSEFFTFAEEVSDLNNVKVKYMSDANHKWNYGIPNEESILGNKKVQILTHPYTWTEKGYDNEGNFVTLINEKIKELVDSIDSECKHFAGVRDNVEKKIFLK